MLEGYLSIFTKGFVESKQDNGMLVVSDFEQKSAKLKVCLKGMNYQLIDILLSFLANISHFKADYQNSIDEFAD